jgi:hypothetical protein
MNSFIFIDYQYQLKDDLREILSGRNVFLTGFTGLVDKIIVKKLVYSVPGIGTIYLLIQTKKRSKCSTNT